MIPTSESLNNFLQCIAMQVMLIPNFEYKIDFSFHCITINVSYSHLYSCQKGKTKSCSICSKTCLTKPTEKLVNISCLRAWFIDNYTAPRIFILVWGICQWTRNLIEQTVLILCWQTLNFLNSLMTLSDRSILSREMERARQRASYIYLSMNLADEHRSV